MRPVFFDTGAKKFYLSLWECPAWYGRGGKILELPCGIAYWYLSIGKTILEFQHKQLELFK